MGYCYTITKGILNRLRTQGYATCYRCGKPFKIGDKVISRYRRKHSRRYHVECFEKMFLVVQE
jgi:hypothetical protein